MAVLDHIELPNGITYDISDASARKLDNNDFDTINVTELNAGNVIVTGAARFLNTINGDISGNAETATSATKATQDESGNNIKSTYANAISISDHTITLKNKNGASLGTVTVPDNNTTYTIATGTANGKIKVTPSSGSAYEVSVYGLKSAAYKDVTDSYSATGTDPVSGKAVAAAIDGLPSPMVFRGSLGTGGTITALPVDGTAKVGDTYKVITAGTYASKAAKVGDTFICLTKTSSANTWELIPSGDEPSGTVTSVAVANGGGLSVSGSPITSSGTITISHADTSSQASVNNSGRTYIQDITLDTYGHVTGITSATETVVNTDRYVNSAAFADATSADANNPIKMTLTRAGSDTASVTAYLPKISSSSAGVAPKGAAVSSQSQSTKFLREDGTWAAPSYTTNTNTTYTIGTNGNNVTLTPSSGSVQSITVPYATSAGSASSATTASKLGSSNVGSATQPIYLSAGTATACTYTLGKSVPSDAKFTDTTYTAGDNMTLSSNTFYATKRWNAITQGQKWSRIILVANTVNIEGNSGLLHVACTRGNTVCNSTFLINTSHSFYGQITELGANNYSKFKVRLVVNSNGDYYVEIYDTASSIASGTTQTWHCSFLSFQPATITAYTTFTDGTTIPSGYTAKGEMETVVGSSALAIRNITRSGTTFTATRQDGTTFTFTQQDNDHYAWSDITSKPTTISGYGITDAKIASGTITLGSNTITPLTASSTLDATKLSGTIPSSCYTDTKNTAGSTDTSSKIFLIGATSQAANPQTYSDDQVYVTSGTLQANSISSTTNVVGTTLAVTSTGGTTGGISLYGGASYVTTYGIAMRTTGNGGKHGYVQGDWGIYNYITGANNRGWVWKNITNGNIASIDGLGDAAFSGSVTIGANATNTSGVRQVYNETTKSLDFVFVA